MDKLIIINMILMNFMKMPGIINGMMIDLVNENFYFINYIYPVSLLTYWVNGLASLAQ